MTPSDNNNFKQHFTVYNFLSMAKNYFQKILVLLLFFSYQTLESKSIHFSLLASSSFQKERNKQKNAFFEVY